MQAPLLPRRLPRLPRRLGLGAALGLVTALGGCATTSPDTSHDWSELGRRDGFARYGDPNIAMRHIDQVAAAVLLASAPSIEQHNRDAAERIVRDRMAGAAELSVPLDVQVGRGRDWNEAAH